MDLGNVKMKKQLLILSVSFAVFSWNQNTETKTAQGDWIVGTEVEKIKTIEKQFRAFIDLSGSLLGYLLPFI